MTAHNDILVWSILAALITPAQAEPVHLACYGKIRVTEFRGSHAEELPTQEGQSMSVIVDRSAGTVAVQEYGPVKLMGNLGDVWVFGGKPENETTQMSFDGYVNSVTGETVIVIHFGHFDQADCAGLRVRASLPNQLSKSSLQEAAGVGAQDRGQATDRVVHCHEWAKKSPRSRPSSSISSKWGWATTTKSSHA